MKVLLGAALAAMVLSTGAAFAKGGESKLAYQLQQQREAHLIAKAGGSLPLANKAPARAKVLDGGEDLSELFGLDIQQSTRENGKKGLNLEKIRG